MVISLLNFPRSTFVPEIVQEKLNTLLHKGSFVSLQLQEDYNGDFVVSLVTLPNQPSMSRVSVLGYRKLDVLEELVNKELDKLRREQFEYKSLSVLPLRDSNRALAVVVFEKSESPNETNKESQNRKNKKADAVPDQGTKR